MSGPDRKAALAQYRTRAAVYDLELRAFEPLRQRAVERLALRAGETVLDIACGTGLSLPLLAPAVGRRGQVVGIEQSSAMLALAQARAAAGGWPQVSLIESPLESARFHRRADAALLHFTHDVLQNDDAVANLWRHLKPGARVVATGLQWAPPWALPVNLFVWGAALRSVSGFDGLGRPWRRLEPHLRGLRVQDLWGGAIYMADGVFVP